MQPEKQNLCNSQTPDPRSSFESTGLYEHIVFLFEMTASHKSHLLLRPVDPTAFLWGIPPHKRSMSRARRKAIEQYRFMKKVMEHVGSLSVLQTKLFFNTVRLEELHVKPVRSGTWLKARADAPVGESLCELAVMWRDELASSHEDLAMFLKDAKKNGLSVMVGDCTLRRQFKERFQIRFLTELKTELDMFLSEP